MPAICLATACSLPTSACRACRTWPSSAATWRTPRCAACSGRRAPPATSSRWPISARSTSWKPGPSSPRIATARFRRWPTSRVRYVGQPIVACMQPSRAQAEDLADQVELELEALPAVVDAVAAMKPGSPRAVRHLAGQRLHRQHRDRRRSGHRSPLRRCGLRRQFRMNRQATVSLECRGVLAYWDHRNDELVVYLSTQGGHVVRIGLAQALGLPENKVRIIAPDIGGGFGGKNRIMPEDIAVAAIAIEGRPSGALDRGPARASARLGARARPFLRSDRFRDPGRHAARRRGRGLYRRRRLFAVADRLLHGSQHGVAQSDRPLSHPASRT